MAVVPGVSAAATAVLRRATSTVLRTVAGRVANQAARPRRPRPADTNWPITTAAARAFSAKARKARKATGPGRKAQLLARFAQLGTTFDVHGPVDELYHPHEAATTRGLFEQPGEFLSAAADQHECEALNPDGVPEIAFVGRSNVGKSSLLNALMRTTAVNTSKSPGRTKGLNFFGVGHGSLRLVDLPGYGYARASKDTVRELHRRIYEYLFTRDRHVLMHVFVLVDVRRGQPSAADLELMRGMDREGTRYRVVLTKMDTVTSEDDLKQTIVNTTHLTRNNLACDPVVSVVSAKLGVGVDELRHSIGQLVAERQGLADFVPAAPFIEDPAGEFGGDEFATGGWGKER